MKRRPPTDETVADYDVRSPATRTLLTVIATLVVAAVAVGAVLGISILMRDTRAASSQIDLSEASLLVVDASEANVRVVEGEADVLTISSEVTSGLRKTSFEIGRRQSDRRTDIKVVASCQSWLNPGCGVDATLEVPPGLPLVIRTSSGNITASSIAKGVLTTRSTTGDIKATGLGVDEFSAETTSGDIGADFTEPPFGFKATTTSGDVRALVPSGERTYKVMTKTTSGEVDNQIASDTGGEGFVRVTTGSGDIVLDDQ